MNKNIYKGQQTHHLKVVWFALIALWFLFPCSAESRLRDEATNRYADREKKIVAYQWGFGEKGYEIKRFLFDDFESLISNKDIKNNIQSDWAGLNPEVNTVRGLEKYLQGDWISEYVTDLNEPTESYIKVLLNVSGSIFTFDAKGTFKNYSDTWQSKETHRVVFKPNGFVVFSLLDSTDKRDQPEINEVQIKIRSRDSFTMLRGDVITFTRHDRRQ